MTTIQWEDGNVLTAGSLRLLPQHYITQTQYTTAAVNGSTTAYVDAGSVFVSGGQFTQALIVQGTLFCRNQTLGYDARIFTSGTGLGGGSEVFQASLLSDSNNNPTVFNPVTYITANNGWAPGSDVVIFMQARHDVAGNDQISFTGFTVHGTGG